MSDQDTSNTVDTAGEENKLIAERRAKLALLRADGVAFPNDFRRTEQAGVLQGEYGESSKEELEAANREFTVAGRLIRNRGAFLLIQDESGQIQLYVDRKGLDEETLTHIKSWDLGDIVGASGPLHKSGKGDLYINMDSARLLTKALRPLPDKYHGLADQEIRYRQRYVDLIVNPESREVFRTRSRIIAFIRNYMAQRDFMEVETPMMQVIPGGATARPFVTHHNALDMDMYLRIAPELYLKRLTVGGLERVFEINRSFRNEGLSTRHNPEFTMLEFYWAYADYQDAMNLTEDMLRELTAAVLGRTTVEYQGSSYDFSKPFERMTLFESVLHFNPGMDAVALAQEGGAREIARGLGIELKESWGLGKVQVEIFEKTVEHRLDQPTFITAYPTEVSPLARRNDSDPFVTDRFEFFVGGREIANGFSELNDPEDQAERFLAQVAEKDAGDDEAMHYDHDYIRALEYGMPPTAGEGIGIDRLVMLLTDSATIRDVLPVSPYATGVNRARPECHFPVNRLHFSGNRKEEFFLLIRHLSTVGLAVLLAACAPLSGNDDDTTAKPDDVVSLEPELELNMPTHPTGCVDGEPVEVTLLDVGFAYLVAGQHVEAVTSFQRYRDREGSAAARWEADIAIAYDSMLPGSPFYDPEAARLSYSRLADITPQVERLDEKVLMMRDSLALFSEMAGRISDLRSDNRDLEESLRVREEAIKRLRELTLGQ